MAMAGWMSFNIAAARGETMRHVVKFSAIAALALTACGDTGGDPPDPAETKMPVKPDGSIGDGAQAISAAPGGIPQSLRGVWDYIDGTCDPMSDLRTEIGADEIVFYESMGQVTDVSMDSESAATVQLAMSGEGEAWEETIRFELSADGETMTRSYPGEESPDREMRWKRCPQ